MGTLSEQGSRSAGRRRHHGVVLAGSARDPRLQRVKAGRGKAQRFPSGVADVGAYREVRPVVGGQDDVERVDGLEQHVGKAVGAVVDEQIAPLDELGVGGERQVAERVAPLLRGCGSWRPCWC